MSPSEWGSALLDSSKRPELEAALLARLVRGHFSAVEMLLDQLDPTEASHLAALDASVRKLAEVELAGETLPDDLKADVLAAASDTLVCIGESVQPTLALAGAPAHRAAIAALSETHPLSERLLDPHRTERRAWQKVFADDCLTVAMTAPLDLQLPWLVLARNLYKHQETDKPRVLRLVEHLLAGTMPGVAGASELENLLPSELELILRAAAMQGGDGVFERAWRLLDGRDLGAVRDAELVRKLWLRVPAALLPDLCARGVAIEFAALLPHHYVEWLRSGSRLPFRAAEHCPLEAAHEALLERGPACTEPDALELLLERSPRLAGMLLDRLFGDSGAADSAELERLGAPALSRLVEALPEDGQLLLLPRNALDRVRALLAARIQLLGPRVEPAIFRLRSLEMALGPLRR
jgi:hypothetical protein